MILFHINSCLSIEKNNIVYNYIKNKMFFFYYNNIILNQIISMYLNVLNNIIIIFNINVYYFWFNVFLWKNVS